MTNRYAALAFNGRFFEDKARGVFVAAAVGDALGWPREDRSQAVKTSLQRSRAGEFTQWLRRSGGRYYAHEEVVAAGEYSDDTQLTIATARSLVSAGVTWFNSFTRTELPFWAVYERGGGRATKAAAQSWTRGVPPWRDKSPRHYFAAGGNGVAMRISPHVLYGARTDFRAIAADVFENGLATHGHPRALLGAIVYAYALWRAFHRTETLSYGGLVGEILQHEEEWSGLPVGSSDASDWLANADNAFGGSYQSAWDVTVGEMKDLLSTVREAIHQESLSVDEEVLRSLGVFDKRIGGAGTISAAASMFLASRYAADPEAGLVRASRLQKADTDTVAAMTGGILGAVCGCTWLLRWTSQLQDANYLERLAINVLTMSVESSHELTGNAIRPGDIQTLLETLDSLAIGQAVRLPNGWTAALETRSESPLRSKKKSVRFQRLRVDNGPTLFISRIKQSSQEHDLFTNEMSTRVDKPPVIHRVGFKLISNSLDRTRDFYERVLGVPLTKETRSTLTFGHVLQFVAPSTKERTGAANAALGESASAGRVIWIETSSVAESFRRMQNLGIARLEGIQESSQRRWFRCLDPDGYLVEVFEAVDPSGFRTVG